MFSYKTITLLIISVVVVSLSSTTTAFPFNLRSANDNTGSELEVAASETPKHRSLDSSGTILVDCGDRCKCSNDGIDKEDGRIILFKLVATNPLPLCVDKDFATILASFLPMLYTCEKIVKDSAQNSGKCRAPVNGDNED